jgi:hypothetical protein
MTLAKAKAEAKRTFIAQTSLTIVTNVKIYFYSTGHRMQLLGKVASSMKKKKFCQIDTCSAGIPAMRVWKSKDDWTTTAVGPRFSSL